jgi:hypothetical protein
VDLNDLDSCTSLGGINIRMLGFVIQVTIYILRPDQDDALRMSTSKELQSLAARKEKECLPEFVLTLGSTRLLLVDPRVFWQCTFLNLI